MNENAAQSLKQDVMRRMSLQRRQVSVGMRLGGQQMHDINDYDQPTITQCSKSWTEVRIDDQFFKKPSGKGMQLWSFKDNEELLTSQIGVAQEMESKTMKLKADQNGAPDKIGAMRHVNTTIVPHRKYFPSLGINQTMVTDVNEDNIESQESSLFEGFCPYGFDQAFYISKQNKIYKATFKGEKLIALEELNVDLEEKKATMLKVIDGFLAIGFENGSFILLQIEMQTRKIMRFKEYKNNGFVRDLHLYRKPGSKTILILVLYVQPGNKRIYRTSQFLLEDFQLKKYFEQPEYLYQISNDDIQTRVEHRREFNWWESFRPLGTRCVAYQVDENSVGFLDLEYCIKLLNSNETFKVHTGLKTDTYLNWVFLLSPENSFSLDPDQIKEQKELIKLIVVNKNGVQIAIQYNEDPKPEGQLISPVSPDGQFEILFELDEIKNYYKTGGKLTQEPWKPFDACVITQNCQEGQGKKLLIAGTMGLFKVDLLSEDKNVEQIQNDNFYQITKSSCGRIVAVTGRSKYIYLYCANSMTALCSLPYNNIFHLRMSSEHLFFKSKHKCWNVVSLQESEIVRTLDYRLRVRDKGQSFQKILFDKVTVGKGKYEDYVVGISSKKVSYHPPQIIVLAKNIAFSESKVTATNLKSPGTVEVEMMTEEEAQQGFKVFSVVLHTKILTWLMLKDKTEKSESMLIAKQANMNTGELKEVTINIERFVPKLFGGFYLSVCRENPFSSGSAKPEDKKNPDAIIVFADSRDPDVRMHHKKYYIQVDFASKKHMKFVPPTFVQNSKLPEQDGGNKADKEPTYFVLNDGKFFNFRSENGKNLCKKDKMWDLKAAELRLSPYGDHIVKETYDGNYFVGKLNPNYVFNECQADETAKNERLYDEWNINAYDPKLKQGLKALQTVIWLTNGYFAIGEFIDKQTEPQSYMVYRADNGNPLLHFNLNNEFEWLKSNTAPNLHSTSITGILDKKTNKIYHVSIFSLIHLGAKRCNINPNCEIFNSEKNKLINDDRPMVLGNLAPALFFMSLKELEDSSQQRSKQTELIEQQIFRCSTVQTDNNQVKLQNMFVYLCRKGFNDCLKLWLIKDSNYFSDGHSPSPLSETSAMASKIVYDWIKMNDSDRQTGIYSGVQGKELKNILKLPIKLINDICENVTKDYSNDFTFNSAEIKEGEITTIDDLDKLTNIGEQSRISKDLFQFENKSDKVPIPGDPFQLNVSLIKFNLHPGSFESRKLLYDIAAGGAEDINIFLNTMIQQLLEYKYRKVKWLIHIMFLIQLTYLICVVTFPANNIPDFAMVLVFLIIFMIREALQYYALYRMENRISLDQFTDYFGFWNILDWINMICMIAYLSTYEHSTEQLLTHKNSAGASLYSIMTLVTWLNLMQYLRLYETFRFFIDLVKAVFLSGDTWKFFIVMFIMIMAFTSSMFLLQHEKALIWDQENQCAESDEDCEPELNPYSGEFDSTVDGFTLLPLFKDFVYTSFGDFGQSEGLAEGDWMQIFIFSFAILFMCLIMLNLLIGILSGAMEGALETKEQSDYAALCDIIFDIETLMFWSTTKDDSSKDPPFKHIVFAKKESEFGDNQSLEDKVDGINEKLEDQAKKIDDLIKLVTPTQEETKKNINSFRALAHATVAINRMGSFTTNENMSFEKFGHFGHTMRNRVEERKEVRNLNERPIVLQSDDRLLDNRI